MTRRIRIPVAVLILAALAAPAAAQRPSPRERDRPERPDRLQDDRNGPEVTERFSRTLPLGRSGLLDISNVAGDVVITGGGGTDVRIDAVKRTRNRNEAEGRARLQEIDILVRGQANRVEVRTEYPRDRRSFSGSVDYTVAVPQGADIVVKSVSGNLRVTNVRGGLRADTVSGDIDASGSRRLEFVRSVSGDLRVTDVESTDLVTIQTVSGNQVVRGLKARGIDSNSVSGDILLENVEAERADLKTVSGNIGYNGRLARNGRYDMTSHSGDIRLAVADIGFTVEASTFSGDFRSDYAMTLRGNDRDSRGRRGPRLNRSVRGSYGDASAILSLRTFSGNIVIAKR